VKHCDATVTDAHALRALRAGTASEDQQRRALDWILLKACRVGDLPWEETDRETAFAIGRMFVGKEIGHLLICDLSTLRREDERPSNP
jgi:hypothetical protein